jgi:hypothetical protein
MTDLLPTAVYLLCFLASTACAVLLARGYRRSSAQVLLWSALCFFFLALNNLTLVLDLVVFGTTVDLRLLRHGFTLAGIAVLLFGFIWDLDE